MKFDQLMERVRSLQARRDSVSHLIVRECPFCGRVALLYALAGHWRVECSGFDLCGANGPLRETAEDAARAWNEAKR